MNKTTNRVKNILFFIFVSYLLPADYLILTPSSLLSAAEKISEIYSSDPTNDYYLTTEIHIVDSMSHEEIKSLVNGKIELDISLKYLLIIGDESNFPDYTKSVSCGENNTIVNYPSDDYFSSNSDNFLENSTNSSSKPRLATGRIPANNLTEALVYVNKLEYYITNQDFGPWRSKAIFVSDDENKVGSNIETEINHTIYSDNLYNKISEFTFSKTLYGPMYSPVYYGSERRLPGLTTDIISNLNKGVGLINYIGHGDPEKWSEEHIIDKNRDINLINIQNHKLPIWIAGTCSFGRYDNIDSMSESLLFDVNGAISIVGAARSISESVNRDFSESFFDKLKIYIESSEDLRLGDLFLYAKNSLSDAYYMIDCNGGYLFNILGDPAIPLPFAKKQINEQNVNMPESFEILTVYDFVNENEYSYVEILEQEEEVEIIYENEGVTLQFTQSPNLIYHNEFSESTCFIPSLDMIPLSNQNSFVNIKFYSQDYDLITFITNSNMIEILYNEDEIYDLINKDSSGPDISFLINDISIESNSYISNNSMIKVMLTDPLGINISNNIGHNTRYWFSNSEFNEIVVNENYIFSESCEDLSFEINLPYNFNDNILFIESWDNINNMSIDSLKLNISNPSHPSSLIYNIFNFPNPFNSRTFFTYQIKDYSSTKVFTEIVIYSQDGRIVKRIFNENTEMINFVSIEWDGADLNQNLVPNGTYLYTININLDNQTYKKSGLLSIIR